MTSTEAVRECRKRKKSRGQCSNCSVIVVPGKTMCKVCLEKMRIRSRAYKISLVQETLKAYGGECICCGQSNWKYLQIDHVHDDAVLEGKRLGCKRRLGGHQLYAYLKKQGFPRDRYQILCANCNFAKQYRKVGVN